MRFKIILEKDEEIGGFIASCPSLPGCFSQGEAVEGAIEYIKEAIQTYWNPWQKMNCRNIFGNPPLEWLMWLLNRIISQLLKKIYS
jgi:hypothetical protein